jgi:hypothetical protein
MKTTGLLGNLKGLAIIAALVIGSAALPAQAGETSVYLKTGWFTWDEKVNGSSFVKEKGFLHGAGIARKDDVSALSIAELLEVWGGNLDYDGHDLTGSTPIKSDTSYLGTREQVDLAVKIPVGSALSFEPFAALGHKFWIRTRSSEDWNSFYARAGVAGELKSPGCTLFVKGGAVVPIYTRTHVSLSDAGFTDVVTEPKSQVSGFAEGGMKLGAFAVSVEYEGMRFGQSGKVVTTRLSGVGKGVAVIGGQAFQPESSSDLFSLKLSYSF